MADPTHDSGPVEVKTPRQRCYHEIRHVVTGTVAEYYKKNPAAMAAPDAEAKLDQLIKMMLRILSVLNKYAIEDLQEEQVAVIDAIKKEAGL